MLFLIILSHNLSLETFSKFSKIWKNHRKKSKELEYEEAHTTTLGTEANDFNINESEYIQDLDNQLEFYQLEEPKDTSPLLASQSLRNRSIDTFWTYSHNQGLDRDAVSKRLSFDEK